MLVNIILYLIQLCHLLYQQNCWLINFICRYIPLKQWAFDDSHSPKYQKFKIITRTGTGKILTATMSGNTADLSDLFIAALHVTFRKHAHALPAKHPILTCTVTMARPGSLCVRSVAPDSHRMRIVLPGCFPLNALTVPTH